MNTTGINPPHFVVFWPTKIVINISYQSRISDVNVHPDYPPEKDLDVVGMNLYFLTHGRVSHSVKLCPQLAFHLVISTLA